MTFLTDEVKDFGVRQGVIPMMYAVQKYIRLAVYGIQKTCVCGWKASSRDPE